MKIIEGLKSIKNLNRKLLDIRNKISLYSADFDCDTPMYPDQKRQVSAWLQGSEDIVKEISNITYRIHKTNINTEVTIVLGANTVTKSIAEWLYRVNKLASEEKATWEALNVRDIGAQNNFRLTGSTQEFKVKRRLYFEPALRDKKIEAYSSEISEIHAKLEIVNATTDLAD